MELTFEPILTFNDGAKTSFAHEPNNVFGEFFMESNERLANKFAIPYLDEFDDLTFKAEPRLMTIHPVKDFGVKTSPHFGSYGYYTPKYTPTSIVVIPIRKTKTKTAAPEVVITDTGTTIHVAITSDYECHRIIVRLDALATEFITYADEFDFVPMYTGDCFISVIGHSNEISVTSEPYETEMTLVDRTEKIISTYVMSVNHVSPDATGNVDVDDAAYVKSVNSVTPDVTGNVFIDGEDVGFSETGYESDTVEEAVVEATPKSISIVLAAANWSANQITVAAPGVTATNTVIVGPLPASQDPYVTTKVICIAQGAGTLTFECTTTPVIDLNVGVVIML